METSFHQTIANDVVSLDVLMDDVTTFLEAHSVDAGTVFLANLGIEEIITNLIKYGYDKPGTYMIEVKLHVAEQDVSLVIIDDGHPFNPINHEVKDTAERIKRGEIGGLGIHLAKKRFDRFDYRREDNRNIVELRARRKSP
jgi:serine/threonine-protein kinase RsbW